MRTDDLTCDIDEWIREAESSTREFNDKKEKLSAFREAGWWDNGSTYLSYYKRFTTKSGTEYFSEVSLSADGTLIWSRGGGLTDFWYARGSDRRCGEDHRRREDVGGKGDI